MESGPAASTVSNGVPCTSSIAMKVVPSSLVDFVDGDDVGVIQRGGGARLLHEPAVAVRIGGRFGRQHLDGDRPAEPDIDRTVNDPHAAAAQLLVETVVGECWQRSGIIRGVSRVRRLSRTCRLAALRAERHRRAVGPLGVAAAAHERRKRFLVCHFDGQYTRARIFGRDEERRAHGAVLVVPRGDVLEGNRRVHHATL